MRILLTNDDGFDAPGLAACWRALQQIGQVDIDVIAPARCHSNAGHTLSDNLRIHRRTVEPMGQILVVEGTPVDCVCAAVHLTDRPRPDWVVAGINRGGNLGVDVYTSGTVAAARQGAIYGIPSIAISQLVRKPLPDDWNAAAQHAAAILAALIAPDSPPPPGVTPHLHAAACLARAAATPSPAAPCWNVNLPRAADATDPIGVRLAPLSRDPIHLRYTHHLNPDGSETLHYAGDYMNRPVAPNSDVDAAFTNHVTLTPLPL